jgi:hypothetical protein
MRPEEEDKIKVGHQYVGLMNISCYLDIFEVERQIRENKTFSLEKGWPFFVLEERPHGQNNTLYVALLITMPDDSRKAVWAEKTHVEWGVFVGNRGIISDVFRIMNKQFRIPEIKLISTSSEE